uniref:Globin family profile domain-containing protein n=1 Tax=Meloidogyne javanica TaxID=6303 RepID=A0A915LK18_MELJA
MGQTQSYASNRPLKDINTGGGSSGRGGGIKKGISNNNDQQKKQSISSVPINFRQRNKIPEQRQKTPSNRNFHPSQKRQTEQKRQSRSQSLDPKAVNQIKTVFGSARCSPRTNTTSNSKKNISNREKELWNPEKAAAQLIGLQLQNPHTAQQNLLCLVGGKLKQTNTNLNTNIGQSPRPFRKQSGQFCSFDLDFRIYEKHLTLAGLTKHQISILQKMWELSTENEITDCTKNIMSHLLRSNAQMYQFFDLLGLNDREVLLSSTFLRQSANFATVLDFVLTNLNNETQKVCLALQCLGAKHSRLPWPIEPY